MRWEIQIPKNIGGRVTFLSHAYIEIWNDRDNKQYYNVLKQLIKTTTCKSNDMLTSCC